MSILFNPNVRINRMNLASDSISASSPLFKNCWIPGKVIVDDMSAVTMQIDTFLSNLRANQNFR